MRHLIDGAWSVLRIVGGAALGVAIIATCLALAFAVWAMVKLVLLALGLN